MTLRRGIVSVATLGILLCIQSALPIGAIADTSSPFGDRPDEVDLSNTYRLPSVFVDEMQVSQQEDAVNGTFGVINENAEIVGNLRYRVELYGDMPGVDPTGNPAVLYSVTEATELPALAPGERMTEDFTASLAGIPDGSYQLRVQLVHGRGRLLGWHNKMIVVRNGAPAYVGLYGASITLPEFDKSVAALTGPNVDPKGSFTITALTENTAKTARTLTPRLRLYPMDFSEKAVEDMNFAPVAIVPGESTFDLTLTAPEKSGVYAGTLELMDGETVVSSIGEYRIVVRGMDADVLSSRLANGVSKEGDTAFVRIDHVGPSDAETRGTGLLNIDISDAKGVAGMVTIPGVPLSDGVAQGTAQVTLNRDIEGDARLTVRILAEDGTLLARQTSVIGAATLQSANADMLMLWMEWYTKPGSVLFFAGMIGLLASLILIGRSLRINTQGRGFQRAVSALAIFVVLVVQIQPALAQDDERAPTLEDGEEIWRAIEDDVEAQQSRFGGSNGIEVWSPITVGENAAFVPNPIHYMLYWGGIANKPIVELFVNKPIHNSTIQCDKDIDFDVRVNYASCNNILSAVRVIARFDANGNKQSTLQGTNADWKEVFDESYVQPIACTTKACIHSRTFTGKIRLDGLKSGATQTTLQVVAKHNPFFDNVHQIPNDTIDPNDEYFRRHFVQAFNIWLMCKAPDTDITVQKNAPSQVNKGDKIQYDLTVSNIGQSDAANVTVTDPIPAGLTYIDNESDSRCNQSGNNVVCQLGTLAKGANTNLRITMQTGAQTVCGNVRNVASVATTTPETNNNNNQDDANTNVLCPVPQADVQIQKSGPSSVNRGNTVGYSLIVKNNGPDTAQNVVVTDAVPTGLTYIDSQSDSRCDLNGNNVVCQLGSMTNQQQTSIGLTFQTSNNTPCGPVVNVASVATTTQETNNGNNQSSFTTNVLCASSSSSSSSTPPGCIEVLKEAFDPAGNKLSIVPQFTFTLDGSRTAINDSTGRAVFTNVTPGTHTVVETVPNGWTLFNVTPANGTVTVVGGSACAGISFKNRQNLPSSSSSSSSSTPIADVQITKSGPASVTRGGTISYTLTARNNGPAVAAGVVVSDPVPAGTTYIDSQSDSRCDLNVSVNKVFCNIGTLSVNQSTSINLTFQTSNATACGQLQNIAYISTDTQETNSGNNQSSFNTNVLCPSSSSSSSSSTPPGCIEILKEAFNPFGTKLSVVPQFTFVLDGSRTVMNDSTGRATFTNVTPGTHTVTEVVPTGWNLFNITPANGTVTVVGGSACAGITFKNQQLPASSSSSSSSSTPIADVSIVKTGASTVNRGGIVSYTLTARNNGPAAAAGVVVSDPVPAGTTYIDSQSDSRCDLNNTNNTVYCNIGTLNTNQSTTMTLAFQTSNTTACGALSNIAYISTDTQESTNSNNQSSFITNVLCASSSSSSSSSQPGNGCIEILKEAFNPFGSELSVVPQFTFTLDGTRSVTNDSNGRATFTDVTPGTHIVSEIVPNGWFMFNVTPANGTVNVTSGPNCAGITFKNQQMPVSSSSSSSSSTGLPDMVIEKSGPATVQQGSDMSYTLTVRNTGNSTAQNISVTDVLPSGTTYVSSSGATCSVNGQTLSCSIGNMSSGEVRTISVTVRVQSTVACGGTLTNVATVSTTSNESNTGNNNSNQVNTLVQCPTQFGCIEVTKEIFDVNGNQIFSNIPSFTFTLDGNRTVVNDSNGKARYNDVTVGTHTVIETVPSGWTLQSVSPSNGTVQVSAGSSCAQVLFRNRQTTTTNDFSISKTDGESEVEPGDTLTYTITVRNNSNVTVNNVTVTDTLPDEVNFEDCSDNCSRSGRFITWSNQTFGPNEEKEYEVEVEVDEDADGELENIAQVFDKTARDRTDVEEEDDDDDEDIEIDLTKTANTSEVFPGGIIEYTIRLKNTGNDTIEDLTIEDTLPPEVIVIDDGDADDHNGNRLSWDINELDEDDTWTATYRVSVSTSAFPGQILRNEVCVESDDDDDIDECESVTVAVIGNLPQTGVMGNILGGGSSATKLRPIRLNGGASPLSNDPIAPLAAWLSVAGLGIGAGMGAARKLLIGF